MTDHAKAKTQWRLTKSPWRLTKSPWRLTKSPWRLTKSPWRLMRYEPLGGYGLDATATALVKLARRESCVAWATHNHIRLYATPEMSPAEVVAQWDWDMASADGGYLAGYDNAIMDAQHVQLAHFPEQGRAEALEPEAWLETQLAEMDRLIDASPGDYLPRSVRQSLDCALRGFRGQ